MNWFTSLFRRGRKKGDGPPPAESMVVCPVCQLPRGHEQECPESLDWDPSEFRLLITKLTYELAQFEAELISKARAKAKNPKRVQA